MALAEYARKRDFQKTAEPGAVRLKTNHNRFVVQKHAASRLHYDFRLEMDGVLKSWAVPKGVPFAKGEKRLAVRVEDHPVSYIHFEGSIPKGQYGGGTVMVWDEGVFVANTETPLKDLEQGKLHFVLEGKKLRGEWYLVQLRGGDQWLLIKGGEDLRPVSKKMDDTSALSGKSMVQLVENGKVWKSSRPETPVVHNREPKAVNSGRRPTRQVPAANVEFIEPMKARLADAPPSSGNWIYEIKFDGYRALAFKHGEQVQLLSRNQNNFNAKFPEIAEAVGALNVDDAVLDGEIVALDKKGVSSFQLLQAFELGEERPPIYYYLFDVLKLDGKVLTNRPLLERKARLEELLGKKSGRVRYSASLGEHAEKLLEQAEKLGLEGLIGKRKNSIYEPGLRSGAWIKLKLHREQEFVIGGYTDPAGSRERFGALLIGFYDQKKLKFCGKVGTGFDLRALKKLHAQFQPLTQEACPFFNLPEAHGSRYSAGVTAAEMRRCHWLEPRLVCQVKFSEWTRDEKLRQPVFLGLREDKLAKEVVREKAR